MTTRDPSPATQRYHATVHAVLDFHIERLAGQFVCDGFDATREHFTRQKAQADGALEKRRLSALKSLLKTTLRLVRHDHQDQLADFVSNRTGHELQGLPEWQGRQSLEEILAKRRPSKGYSEIKETKLPDGTIRQRIRVSTGPRPDFMEEHEAVSPDGRLRLMVTQYQHGEHVSTSVTLVTPTASGPVYSVFELRPDIRAEWIDNRTIRIAMLKTDPRNICYHEIRSLGDTVRVEYVQGDTNDPVAYVLNRTTPKYDMPDTSNNGHPARSINDSNHLVRPANRLLGMAARATWKGIRLMAGIALLIPRWFVRINKRPHYKRSEDLRDRSNH